MKPGSRSLVRELQLRLLLPLLAIVAVTAALGAWWAQRLVEQTLDRWLLDSARALAQHVHFRDGIARLDLGGDAEAILSFDVVDRTYYSVRQGGRLVAGHPAVPSDGHAQEVRHFDAQIGGEAVRVAQLTLADSGAQPPAVVSVAETRRKRDAVVRDIQPLLIPTGVLLLLAATAIGGVVRSTLRPVQALADQWLDQSQHGLDAVDARTVPRELHPLASALNQLIERLREVLARERRFTANAAHQIRTPLAGLQLGLNRASQAPDLDSTRAVIAELQTSTQRTARLVQQLLALTRLEPEAVAQLEWRTVDLAALARTVGESFVPRALAAKVNFELIDSEGPVWARVQPELLSEALSNLIDNALRYGCSGTAHPATVRIRVSRASPQWVVEDAGEGIAPDRRAGLRERFARGPNPQVDGSGLGLSIADDILTLHGGHLSLHNSALGGLAVHCALPEAAARLGPSRRMGPPDGA